MDAEEDKINARNLFIGHQRNNVIRFGAEKAYLCIFIPSNNFIQCLLDVAD